APNQPPAVNQPHLEPTRHLVSIEPSVAIARRHEDLVQKTLDVRPNDALGFVLFRQHLTIEDGDGDHVGQAVVRLFLDAHVRAVDPGPTAGDVIGDTEDFDANLFDV